MRQRRIGAARSRSRPASSFTLTGFLLATLGAASGFDSDWVRLFGAALLVAAGVALLVPSLQVMLARAATPLADWTNARQAGMERHGLAGQAAIGILLGLVWSPCVGPTLGAATVLAAPGENLTIVAVTMAAFGMGIASVLLVLASATRSLLACWRGRLMTAGGTGKQMLGGLLMVVGVLIFIGVDKTIETPSEARRR